MGGGHKEKGGKNGESSMETYTLPYVKQIASGNLQYNTESSTWRCGNLTGWDGVKVGRRLRTEGTYVCVWLIHFEV